MVPSTILTTNVTIGIVGKITILKLPLTDKGKRGRSARETVGKAMKANVESLVVSRLISASGFHFGQFFLGCGILESLLAHYLAAMVAVV